jgi:hypothetical protein
VQLKTFDESIVPVNALSTRISLNSIDFVESTFNTAMRVVGPQFRVMQKIYPEKRFACLVKRFRAFPIVCVKFGSQKPMLGVRWADHPHYRAFADRLDAAGKPFKVVITACMRKLLTILNVMLKTNSTWNPNFTLQTS